MISVMPRPKPQSKKPPCTDPRFYVNRIIEKSGTHAEKWGARYDDISSRAKNWRRQLLAHDINTERYVDDRDYDDYAKVFGPALTKFFGSRKILKFKKVLELIMRGDKNPVIIEDGAGRGAFLHAIKPKLKRLGISPKTIALALPAEGSLTTDILKLREESGSIDKVVLGPAELFVPKEKANVIISLVGSMNHTIDEYRKDNLLKFAYSLKRGGLMMVAFAKDTHGPGFLEGVKRSFYKRGFDAEFYDFNLGPKDSPKTVLIAVRMK